MANERQLGKLKKGADVWNPWIKSAGERPDLRDADLRGLDLSRCYLKDAQLKGARLNGAKLRKAKLDNAYLRRANLTGADLTDASLSGANLRHAVLRDATLANAYLRRADLSYVDLRGADLSEAVLEYTRLVDVDLDDATLTDCLIYGASVWNVTGRPRQQSNLVITPSISTRDPEQPRQRPGEGNASPTITVDDLEIAQFIYLLLNHRNVRTAINSVAERGVLLLGPFKGGGLARLHAIAAKLREEKYLPIIFDFERPDARDYTDTIRTLAGLSRFVVADLSGPSVPHELGTIVPQIKIPYVFILQEKKQPYSLVRDLFQFDWVVRPIVTFKNVDDLVSSLRAKVVDPAEAKFMKRQQLLTELFGPGADTGQTGLASPP